MNTLTNLVIPADQRRRMPPGKLTVGAVLIVGAVLASAAVATRFAPAPLNGEVRRFYRRLDKPGSTPPDPVFGIWGPLYAAMIVSGLRVWNARPSAMRSRALGHWFGLQALNAVWLWLGFGERKLGVATAVAAVNVVNAGAYADAARKVDRTAAGLALPLAAWLGFAALLTEELWRRNR